MHESVRTFVHQWAGRLQLSAVPVVEVGSYDVNGTVRDLFSGPYTGVDMRPGPGVDVVSPGSRLPFLPGTFGAALCLETLEHDRTPWRTVQELARVVVRGGPVLVTCRGWVDETVFPTHNHPGDYWRFSTGGVGAMMIEAGLHVSYNAQDPDAPGVFAVGVRP